MCVSITLGTPRTVESEMPELLITVIWLLIYIAVAVGVVYLVFWVLDMLGVPIPERVKQVVWVIVVLLVILWIAQALLRGGPVLP